MAQASLIEARNSLLEDLQEQCTPFLEPFLDSLRLRDANPILGEIKRVLAWTDERGEDAHIWQAGIAVLYQKMNTLLHLAPEVDRTGRDSLPRSEVRFPNGEYSFDEISFRRFFWDSNRLQ